MIIIVAIDAQNCKGSATYQWLITKISARLPQITGSHELPSVSYVEDMRTEAGLTVLELLFLLALLGTLLSLGMPALEKAALDSRMAAQVNGFVRGIHLAKQTALKNNTEIVICKSTSGKRCEHDQAWHTGWVIFSNRDRDYPPQIDPDEKRLMVGAEFEHGRIISNRKRFVFRPFEIRSTNGTLYFCDRRGISHARRIIVSFTGRPRLANLDDSESTDACDF